MPNNARPQKITFAEMRAAGVSGVLVYCQNYQCSPWVTISGDRWPDHVRLSDIEPTFTCRACGKKGGDVRPDLATAPSSPSGMADGGERCPLLDEQQKTSAHSEYFAF
jgi:hypothetical protein